MLRIRREQLRALEERASQSFEDRMLRHVAAHFPEHWKRLGEAHSREFVREGIERARRYDVASERDVCIFVDLMLALGPGFDEDPGLPWAAEILTDELMPDPGDRTDALHQRALDYLREQAAPGGTRA